MPRFSDFDLYRSVPRDLLTDATTHGACLSVVGVILMVTVFIAELWAFLSVGYVTDVVLDPTTDSHIRVSFNISVLDLPCEYLSVDVVDVLGTRKESVSQNINKWAIDSDGILQNYIGRNDDSNNKFRMDEHHDKEELEANGIQAINLDAGEFDNYLAQNKYVFANFYAPWCVWCQRLEPVWEALAESIGSTDKPVKIIKIDCVKNHHFCIRHKVQAFPTLRFFTGGEAHMTQYQSDRTIDSFRRFIDEQLEKDHFVASIKDPEERARAHQDRIEESVKSNNAKKGCNLVGFLMLNRVPGNFHIQARSENHNMNPSMANLTHIVNSLYFGNVISKRTQRMMDKVPNDLFNQDNTTPLNGVIFKADSLHKAYHHYLKVVSTHFQRGSYVGKFQSMVYQMLASSQIMRYGLEDVPEARFTFDLSPMAVLIQRRPMKFYQFVTHICALIGGTFTVIGLFSGVLGNIFKPKKL